MIERLILKNFKSHRDSNIAFSPGLNIFLGEVGAGKTSILESISFALFGRIAANVTRTDLIRRGSKRAYISLEFSTSHEKYKVDRTIYPKKTQTAKLWIFRDDWRAAVNGATAVSKSVEELLGVDSATFMAAFYASQGEIKEMLETQPGKRRERLDKLLGIDTYEGIWISLGNASSLILNELTEAQEKASGHEILKKNRATLRSRMKSTVDEHSFLKNFLQEIKDRLHVANQRLLLLTNLRDKLSRFQTQIEAKESQINAVTTTVSRLDEQFKKSLDAEKTFENLKENLQLEEDLEKKKHSTEALLQQRNLLETLIQRENVAFKDAKKRKATLEAQLEPLTVLNQTKAELSKKADLLSGLQEKHERLEKELSVVTEETISTSNEIESQKKRRDRVLELSECPTCLQTVPQEHKEKVKDETQLGLQTRETAYSKLIKTRLETFNQLDECKSKITSAIQADKEYTRVLSQVTMLEGRKSELKEVDTSLREIELRIQANKNKLDATHVTPLELEVINEQLINVASKSKLAKEAERQMTAKKDFESMLNKERENLGILELQLRTLHLKRRETAENFDADKFEESEREDRILRADEAKTEEGIVRLAQLMSEQSSELKELEENVKIKGKAWREVEKLKKEYSVVEVLRQSLREVVQPLKRKKNILSVSTAFQDFYQELSNDNVDFAAIDEDGNIDVVRNGEPSPVNSLSGGETTCAALALRLAICSALTRNQLLLLDEPTIHLDESYRSKLREFLANHHFENLIVVTHDDTFDTLPAHIFRVGKRENKSIVSAQI
ncbi:SMC family ATPase [Candidatus Bathyarchaeota archaeon]|nr:SMC family ATPase [Candidatus Bathyarchaeota archaeon]